MKRTISVKVQTGFFERTECNLKTAAKGLTLMPVGADGGKITVIPAASVRSVTFHNAMLKMEIQADGLTEMYFANEDDWLDALKTVKEKLGMKIVCEFN